MPKTGSVQEFIGLKNFSRNGLVTVKGEIVFFLIQPTNITVLSEAGTEVKIQQLMHLLSAHPDVEIICTDARENFNDNKKFLNERLKKEDNIHIRKLLQADLKFLDEIQLQMATSREFMFAVRIRGESDESSFANLNRIEKLINEQCFDCRRASKEEIKRIISKYFGTLHTDGEIADVDGEKQIKKWIVEDDD